jgi:hypothetical protein
MSDLIIAVTIAIVGVVGIIAINEIAKRKNE